MGKHKRPLTELEVCGKLRRNGFYPAPTSHLPSEIKAALRRFGIRPGIKLCFANCQRFVLALDDDPGLAARVGYCEGYVDGSIPHAWLTLDGTIVDLTLSPEPGRKYNVRGAATAEQIAMSICGNGAHVPIHVATCAPAEMERG